MALPVKSNRAIMAPGMRDRFEAYVPDVSNADVLLADLGRSRHTSADRYVLLGVSGTAAVRKSWSDTVELSERDFEELRDAPDPEPDLSAPGVRRHRLLADGSHGAKSARCSGCWMNPGRELCSHCGGEGRVATADGPVDCSVCEMRGQRVCSICGGSAKSVKVELIFADDHVTPFAHVFVPNVEYALLATLSRFLRAQSSLPECLGFALDDDHARVDAYRGRRGDEEYRGHRLGDTLPRARHYVERLRAAPSVLALRAEAHVWPFLRLELEGGGLAALVVDAGGVTRVLLPGA